MKRTFSKLIICESCEGVGSFVLYDIHKEESEIESCMMCQGHGIVLETTTVITEPVSFEEFHNRRKVKYCQL